MKRIVGRLIGGSGPGRGADACPNCDAPLLPGERQCVDCFDGE